VKIPIRNLFYLLCYAWDVLDRADDIQVGPLAGPDLENLFAVVLATGVEQQLRRGLERNYLEFREDSKCIRGRVDFQETVKRALFRRKEAHVVGEELSADTLSNRIIKSTIRTLLSFSTLSLKTTNAWLVCIVCSEPLLM
jgi:5-methylcytosine-specific restriction enzyme subunit McrC